MYELIILSLLAQWPLHGYLIAKITNDMLGPYARLSNGRLYPLLAKLEAEGLIVVSTDAQRPSGSRRSRAYAITEAGRLRFHALMMDTTTNLGDYQRIFWYKVPCLYLLNLSERLYLLDHFITYCQTHIFHYVAELADMRQHEEHFQQAPPIYRDSAMFVIEHVLKSWRLQLEDTLQLRARLVAGAERAAAEAASEAAGAGDTDATSVSQDTTGDRYV
jgi:DNA-binding PadR family transcriptional regulator